MRCSLIHQTFSSIIFPFVPFLTFLYQLNLHNILCLVFYIQYKTHECLWNCFVSMRGCLGLPEGLIADDEVGRTWTSMSSAGCRHQHHHRHHHHLIHHHQHHCHSCWAGKVWSRNFLAEVIWCFLRSERHCKADKDSHRLINICAFFYGQITDIDQQTLIWIL